MFDNVELVKDHASEPSPISGCVIASSLLSRVTFVRHPHNDTWYSGTRYCFKHIPSVTILQTNREAKVWSLKITGP